MKTYSVILKVFLVVWVALSLSCGASERSDVSLTTSEQLGDSEYDDGQTGDCIFRTVFCNDLTDSCGPLSLPLSHDFKGLDVEKVTYYIEPSIYDHIPSRLPQIEDFHEVFPNLVGQAAEIWNSESQAPPLVYGGELSEDAFRNKEDVPEKPIVLIRFEDSCVKVPGAQSSPWEVKCKQGIAADTVPLSPKKRTRGSRVAKHILTLYTQTKYERVLPVNINGTVHAVKYIANQAPILWRTIVDEIEKTNIVFTPSTPEEKDPYTLSDLPATYEGGVPPVNLEAILVHEFGHVLGLEHANFKSGGHSVMGEQPSVRETRHLWHWDKKCIRALYHGRKAVYKTRPIDFRGNLQTAAPEELLAQSSTATFVNEPTTNKASRLGLSRTLKDGSEETSVLFSKRKDSAVADSEEDNRLFNLLRTCPPHKNCKRANSYKTVKRQSTIKYHSLTPVELFKFDVNPTFTMLHDGDADKKDEDGTYGYLDSFLYHYSGPKELKPTVMSAMASDPPYVNVSYIAPELVPNSGSGSESKEPKRIRHDVRVKGDFAFLDKSTHEGSDNFIYSHIPISIAYNHLTSTYIQAVVYTSRPPVKDSVAHIVHKDEGGIHFGVYDTKTSTEFGWEWEMHDFLHDATQRLMEKIKKHPYWKPTFKTQFGVAVACTDHFTMYKYDRFNCFLAWIDRGLPRKDNVLYTWFRLVYKEDTQRYDVDWSNKIYVRSDFYAVGHLSAAFVGGALVLVGKSAVSRESGGSSIMISRNPLNKATGFTTTIERFGHNVVDAPSVGAVRYREGGDSKAPIEAHDGMVLWTELQD